MLHVIGQISAKMSNNLKDQYLGCMVGALIGDCLGYLFEGNRKVAFQELRPHINRCEDGIGSNIQLTDDTQMTQELAASLIANKGLDLGDLARRFTLRYFKDGAGASYGANVRDVFKKLKETNFVDPTQPAKEQFGGSGSYGNGAAMRIAPVPLFSFPDLRNTARLAIEQSLVTHTNELAQHGAVFLALAIRRCLAGQFKDTDTYLEDLKKDLEEVNVCEEYLDKIRVIRELVNSDIIKLGEVVEKLGNGVAARRSVPTSVFCFLRGLRPISQVESGNPFRRSIELAILLGGDTDTIASMTGAVAGAFHGYQAINENIVKSCPDNELAIEQAEQLFMLHENLSGRSTAV